MSADFNQRGRHALMVSGLHLVGGGYAVQFKAYAPVDGVLPIGCEWSPTIPSERERRRKVDMRRYDHAVALFTQAVAAAMVNMEGEAS